MLQGDEQRHLVDVVVPYSFHVLMINLMVLHRIFKELLFFSTTFLGIIDRYFDMQVWSS